ncbi:RNA polymerase sigma factor [Niallia sp. MER TA 168]|uniref:RNA polymerase sigma factor n=1 Tax=Niallia sp. MER TA 168 TaxID=2939568 RepID=UPI0020400E2B|nr:sigma-70 family RNA polymerase sigma factor [Niallia sp. MER TA 168]MCM3363789.1 sigma-70 family RNA polymerase sigma factor [Niallia sp. MER TA 168]
MGSIDELYRQYNQELVHFLIYLGVKKEEAEDLVQEVFIRVLKTKCSFKGESSERTWLYTIAKNIAIDHFRKQKNSYSFDCQIPIHIKDEQALPEEIALYKEQLDWLNHLLKCCTVDQKKVIYCRYLKDMSIVETALNLGWSESKVKTTQHRALKLLQRSLVSSKNVDGISIGGHKVEIES